MPTIKTIKPAGGGDYTTLAAWWTAVKTAGSADQWAECYGGGDLGSVTLNGATFTPSAVNYPRIYAATGEQHNGTYDSTKAKVNGSGRITSPVAYIHIEGLQFKTTTGSSVLLTTFDNTTVRNCLFHASAAGEMAFVAMQVSTTTTVATTIDNCIFYQSAASTNQVPLEIKAAGAVVLNAKVYNCTIYNEHTGSGTNDACISLITTAGGTLNVEMKNNIFIKSGTANTIITSGTLITQTGSKNIGTSTGGVIDIASTAATEFNNIASDWSLKTGALALNAGLTLTDATDIIGTIRPQGASWDIGAFETVVSAGGGGGGGTTPASGVSTIITQINGKIRALVFKPKGSVDGLDIVKNSDKNTSIKISRSNRDVYPRRGG